MKTWIVQWVLVLSSQLAGAWNLTLIHTNDMHAWLDEGNIPGGLCLPPGPCFGGFPRVKRFVDDMRRNSDGLVYLNAGDMFQGTNYYTLFKWKLMELFVDKLGIDVMSLGNHEFDDGMSGIVPYLKTVKTPWVCANLKTDQEPSFSQVKVKPYHFLNVKGKKIAVIGYLTPETAELGDTGNLTILDEVASLRSAARETRSLGADVVIALGHSGWDRDLEIARDVPELDLVVGGHSHTFHYTGTPPSTEVPVSTYPQMIIQPSAKVVPMVQAYAWSKYVGVLHLNFDSENRLLKAVGNPVLMDHKQPEDVDLRALLDVWKENVTRILGQEIGTTEVDLDASNCRQFESNLGNLIGDAIVDFRRQQYKKSGGRGWTDAPIAIVNSGEIRASITKDEFNGSITLGALLTVMPFTEKLVKADINGTVFKMILEHSVQTYNSSDHLVSGAFLQYSGVKVVYDVSRPPGERVVSAQVRCGLCENPTYSDLTPDSSISLITTSFLIKGGDGYTWLKSAPKKALVNSTFFEAVKDYIAANSPIKIGLEGRITILGNKNAVM